MTRSAILLALLALAACPGAARRSPGPRGPADSGGVGAVDGKETTSTTGDAAPPAEEPAASMNDERIPGLDRSEAELARALEPPLERARRALAARDFDGAAAAAEAALQIDSEHIEALVLLARACAARGWLDKARAVLERATELPAGAGDARVWMMLGLVRERSGGAPSAVEEAYLEATRRKPNYAPAWINLGALQLRAGRHQEAIASLETAQSIDADSVVALTNLGTAYRRRAVEVTSARDRDDLLRKAERSYRTAILADDEARAAYLDLGLLYADADPFPGLATGARLQAAIRYLTEYKQRTAAAGETSAVPVDDYLDAVRRALEREQRRERRGP